MVLAIFLNVCNLYTIKIKNFKLGEKMTLIVVISLR